MVLRVLFEAISAVFVITSLLVVIYSDYVLLRGVAGIALIIIVSTMTASFVHRYEHSHME